MMPTMALPDVPVAVGPDDVVASLHRAHYRALVRLAGLLLHDRGASEEVVQDAFVQLHLKARRLRDPDKAAAWLRSAVLNGARSRLRHIEVRRRHQRTASGATSRSAEDAVLAGDAQERLVAALRTLPARQREAVVLRFYLELSEAEMAAAMGVSAGSVKTHLHRGLAALQTRIDDQDTEGTR